MFVYIYIYIINLKFLFLLCELDKYKVQVTLMEDEALTYKSSTFIYTLDA